jgi:predicted secreted acid phosphatase
MENFSLLSQVIKSIKSSSKLPIVVFDLDDTLFSTARRNLIIIQNFAADNGDKFPDFAKIAAKLALSDMNWSVANALANAGLPLDSPDQKAFIPYWGSTFFTDDYVSLDLPNPGAVDYVNACYEAGALIYYLTGRHIGDRGLKNGMGQGTVLSITNRGFPYWKGRCELNLKLDKSQKDSDYKDQAIQSINSLKGNVVATFDNEPGNSVVFKNNFPKASNFWVKTTWNPQDNAPTEGLNIIPDFSTWNQ